MLIYRMPLSAKKPTKEEQQAMMGDWKKWFEK